MLLLAAHASVAASAAVRLPAVTAAVVHRRAPTTAAALVVGGAIRLRTFSTSDGTIPTDAGGTDRSSGGGGGSGSGGGSTTVTTGSLSGARDARLLSPSVRTSRNRTRHLARLLVHGPDQKGIVASYSSILYQHGCGIVDANSESSTDDEDGSKVFFQRILFDTDQQSGFDGVDRDTLSKEIDEACKKFGMAHQLHWGDSIRRVAIMVSKYDHCLWELLLRHRAGELDCDLSVVLSNHEDLRHVAETFDVPYEVFPIDKFKSNRAQQERAEMHLLADVHDVDLLILARYMQVLSDGFCDAYRNKIINIHHSFLPAFVGGRPYHRAHERGVKLIGATAHYTTADLDEGPIIEQDITRISHRDEVSDLIRKGRTLEKNVLVSAVKAHLDDRIIVYKNKCIVFSE